MSHDSRHASSNGHDAYTLADAEADIEALEEVVDEIHRSEEKRLQNDASAWRERRSDIVHAVAASVAEVFVPRLEAMELTLGEILKAVKAK